MLGAALEGHLWPWVLSHLRSLTPSLEARVPEGGGRGREGRQGRKPGNHSDYSNTLCYHAAFSYILFLIKSFKVIVNLHAVLRNSADTHPVSPLCNFPQW